MNNQCKVHTGEAITADSRQSAFVNARRVHKALTADLEKRLLVWMAQRTPATINSDDLTALGFVSQLSLVTILSGFEINNFAGSR